MTYQTLRVETAYANRVRHGWERDYEVPIGAIPLGERKGRETAETADWELSYWVPNP